MSHFSHKMAKASPAAPAVPQASGFVGKEFLVVCSHVNVTLQSQKGKDKTTRSEGASGFVGKEFLVVCSHVSVCWNL